jgi:putative endonuclease
MDTRPIIGRSGEDAAVQLLRNRGLTIVERNFRCRAGEIDIVARAGQTVVFCEVKTRKTDRWGDPSEAVGYKKQARLRRLAAEWLRTHQVGRVEIRFDVVSVIVREGRTELRHIPDAF